MSDLVKRYTSSVFFDKRLWQVDIQGSLAHADMLAAQCIINADDHALIKQGMATITVEIESGVFEWKLDLEDVHLNIEARLTALVGDAGKRLHTGRSRNDQVATDIRLWLRSEIDAITELLTGLQNALVDIADKNIDVILPGFTHLQVGKAGQYHVNIFVCNVDQCILKSGQQFGNCINFTAQPQAYISSHLVVAATPCVQPLAGITHQRRQSRFNVQVNVFQIQLPFKNARLNFYCDGCHTLFN